jgi:probable rRNA maturation factor
MLLYKACSTSQTVQLEIKLTQTLTSSSSAPVCSREPVTGFGDDSDSADPDQSEEPTQGLSCAVSLDLQISDCNPPVSGWLEDQLSRIAQLAGVVGGRLAVAVVDDDQMARMHEQYCNLPGTTDVLTFDLRDEPDDPVEGDLVLCMDEAHRQALQRGHDARLELLLYAVHGLMHLLGEDDHDEVGYQKMHRREDELLIRAGLGPVFGL